jgi:hypothetical protein
MAGKGHECVKSALAEEKCYKEKMFGDWCAEWSNHASQFVPRVWCLIRTDNEVPAELDIHLVLDNYATHKTPKVAAWFKKHPRYHLHFTPTSASWLNQVERWFAKLTEQRIRRSAFHCVKALEQAIMDHITSNNANPKP